MLSEAKRVRQHHHSNQNKLDNKVGLRESCENHPEGMQSSSLLAESAESETSVMMMGRRRIDIILTTLLLFIVINSQDCRANVS